MLFNHDSVTFGDSSGGSGAAGLLDESLMTPDSPTVAAAIAAAERTASAEQQGALVAVQTAVAGMTTMDPVAIPVDRALAALLRQVMGVAAPAMPANKPEVDAYVEAEVPTAAAAEDAAAVGHPPVTAADEELLVSFQQASRLCECVFPATIAAQQLTAALAHHLPFRHVTTASNPHHNVNTRDTV